MSTSNSILVLVQSIEQPRSVKRIEELSNSYKKITVFCFKRDLYRVGNYEHLKNLANVEIHFSGEIKNRRILNRIFSYLRLLKNVSMRHPSGIPNCYVFGMDLRAVAFVFRTDWVVYEIGDIAWLYSAFPTRYILSLMDQLLCSKSNRVIFTSSEFAKKYYKRIDKRKIEIRENKVLPKDRLFPINWIEEEKIVIGYIGSLRYSSILERLMKVVANRDNLLLKIYGDGVAAVLEKIHDFSSRNSNIEYYGPFRNPEDLETIYGAININFCVYDNSLENEKVAMPNKFYESGYFNRPIVAAARTYVGRRVLEEGMGWEIEPDGRSIEAFVDSLSVKEIIKKFESIKMLDKSKFAEIEPGTV